jgi:hypothetical protein
MKELRDYTDSVSVNELTPEAEVFFVRLIIKSDDAGLINSNPLFLRSELYPINRKMTEQKVVELIKECYDKHVICKVNGEDGKEFIKINKFKKKDKAGTKYNIRDAHKVSQIQEIYNAYPRHVAPAAAFKAIEMALRKVDFEELLELTRIFAECTLGAEERWIPYPASWFNGERFRDDRTEWKRVGRNLSPSKNNSKQYSAKELPDSSKYKNMESF